MQRPIQFLLFLTIAIAVTAGVHYYLYARLVRDPALSPSLRLLGTVIIWGFYAGMVLFMPLGRFLPRSLASPALWAVYIWMGTSLLTFLTLVALDLVRALVSLPLPPPDPERRQVINRLLAGVALSASGVLSALALRSALRPVAVRNLLVELPRLPKALHGVRVVQLTDLHIGPTLDGTWLRDVVQRVNALAPDVIAITGDLVDGSVASLREHVAPLADLRAAHGVFFVTGNHEYYAGADSWIAELRRLGVRVLRNERVALPIIRSGIEEFLEIAGVDDYHSHSFPGHGPDLKAAMKDRDPNRPVVLLSHQPATIFEAAALGVDLQISGHTHGGQIWPWGYAVRLQQPYVVGLHKIPGSDTQLYVSCGTGYWGPPMRLNAPAEITHITLCAPT